MNTNRHKYRWTCLAATSSRDEGRERGRPARTTLAQPHPFLPPGSTGNDVRSLLRPGQAVPAGRVAGCHIAGKPSGTRRKCMRAGRPRSRPASPVTLAPQRATRRVAGPQPCRADHTRVKHSSVNKDEPRMNTNRHKYRWTCLAATPSWDDAPRERGRPARTTLAQLHPSPPPGLDRQRRHDSASAEPMGFPAAG